MDTAKCKAFIASAELGSFSKAAIQLGYTSSGISQLVSALETELGFNLLLRNNKGVRLSENGERMMVSIRGLLKEEDELLQVAAEIKGLFVGDITIGAYSSISMHLLPPVINEFQKQYPEIKIRLMEGTRHEVEAMLTKKMIDVAFYSYHEPMEHDWIPLQEDQMLAILPPDHPCANHASYPLKQCEKERFIMPALGKDDDVTELFERYALMPNITFTTLENFAVMAMIEQGMGISIMNDLITKKLQFNIKKIPLAPPQYITYGIAIDSLASASPAVKRFITHATKQLTKKVCFP